MLSSSELPPPSELCSCLFPHRIGQQKGEATRVTSMVSLGGWLAVLVTFPGCYLPHWLESGKLPREPSLSCLWSAAACRLLVAGLRTYSSLCFWLIHHVGAQETSSWSKSERFKGIYHWEWKQNPCFASKPKFFSFSTWLLSIMGKHLVITGTRKTKTAFTKISSSTLTWIVWDQTQEILVFVGQK